MVYVTYMHNPNASKNNGNWSQITQSEKQSEFLCTFLYFIVKHEAQFWYKNVFPNILI